LIPVEIGHDLSQLDPVKFRQLNIRLQELAKIKELQRGV